MKRSDLILILVSIAIILCFIFIPSVGETYNSFNRDHGMWMSFIKFAVLATLGESIALRIRSGVYNTKGFGLLPRAVVWGFLGLTIKMAFVIFVTGTPVFLEYLGFQNAGAIMKESFSFSKVGIAFSISAAMNLIYAPVMMTLHKITDIHIVANAGKLYALLQPIAFRKIFNELDWDRQWNFVFKKTIPFFWIPAHTITFLLPEQLQVLFAALLGIALGVLLSISSPKRK
ncbi:MAG: hypothetical protein FD155_2315 [Bacteroidetes bacterium]|nr:MAG: hypothetical protein FD155_2315 [Bacteroidota bacterium]